MDYTNMTFGDLLVADIGALPKHTRINEDIYEPRTKRANTIESNHYRTSQNQHHQSSHSWMT